MDRQFGMSLTSSPESGNATGSHLEAIEEILAEANAR